jgi:predicted PurR-regulated permease PerM
MAGARLLSNRALAFALCVAAVAMLASLWLPLLLAAWFSDLLAPAVRGLERALGGRRRAAAAAVVLLTMTALAPLGGVLFALASGLSDLLEQVRAAAEGRESLAGALLGGTQGGPSQGAPDWANLVTRYGAYAWQTLSAVARISASAAIGFVVFIAALYALASEGDRTYEWLEDHLPIARGSFRRLALAFRETGRGLLIAGGGTALLQGAIATTAYVAIGVPRALLLGPLTAICAIVPVVGTGLVWIPLAGELFAVRQYGRASAILVVGVGVGLVDNFVRPILARHGHLNLPTVVVLFSMLGGAALLGAAGALVGPLVVRLCVESLAILSEEPATADLGPGGK